MGTKELISDSLNEQQVMMLRLLKKPLPEGDFIQIRRLAVQLLSKQLDETIAEWEENNSITEKTYEELNKKHFRRKSANS
jgi:heme oxygenase